MSTQPTRAGFLLFIRGVMGIDPLILPDDNLVIDYALAVAQETVNPALMQLPNGSLGQSLWTTYVRAVYNLGGSNVLNFAQDQDGREYFETQRKKYATNAFQPGLVTTTSDQGTVTSLLNQEAMRTFTLANLQQLKDPYGRQYLAIAQSYGTLWGAS